MGLEAASKVIDVLLSAFKGVSGIGTIVFMIGFFIALILLLGIALTLLIRALKLLPSLTVGQFLKLIAIIGIGLMVLGLILP
ncbi:MAG: hypothetical protein QXP02_01645 [Desulfurococcaceae archaeon]